MAGSGEERVARPTLSDATGEKSDGPNAESRLLGTVISERYRVIELLATGGTSAVYLGQHVHMLKQVAIKVLDARAERLPELVARFQREAIVGAHVRHPNIASASDFGQLADGSYFLVLEYVRGATLDQLIARGPLPLEQVLTIAGQLGEALRAVHAAGIVHRDLKPRNVLLCDQPETSVKLIDFGFAQVRMSELIPDAELRGGGATERAPDKELTGAGIVLGTVAYMAPETALGMQAVDARSDLYALGIILYEMLTGRHPFDATDPIELFLQQRNQRPPRMKARAPQVEVPAAIEALVMKLLAKDPGERHQTADQLLLALRDAAQPAGAPVEKPALAARQPTPQLHDLVDRAAIAVGNRVVPHLRVPAALAAVVVVGLVSYALSRAVRAPSGARVSSGAEEVTALANSAAEVTVPPSSAALEPASDSTLGPRASEDAAPLREVALELDGLDAWAWRMNLRNAARAREWAKGAHAVRALLKLDPAALREVDLQSAARTITVGIEEVGGDPSTRYFSALTHELGPGGLDLLYDVARQRPTSKAGRWATEILRVPEVLAQASAPLRVLFEFRESTCVAKRDLFARMSEQGDDRALAELRALRDAECPKRRDPCCYREHPGLASAIRTLADKLNASPLK